MMTPRVEAPMRNRRSDPRAAIPGFGLAAFVALQACGTHNATPALNREALLLDPTHPEWTRPAPAVSHVRFETTKGSFVVEITRAHAPLGADRFYNLVRLGYYDDTRFHRVNQNYIAQFGIHGNPAVNAA